jgi:hypothetical protein
MMAVTDKSGSDKAASFKRSGITVRKAFAGQSSTYIIRTTNCEDMSIHLNYRSVLFFDTVVR